MKPPTTVAVQGFALRVIREARGRKVADLAEAVGVSRAHLTKVEIGAVPRVSATLYAALLRELAVADYRALMANPPMRNQGETEPEVAIPAAAS